MGGSRVSASVDAVRIRRRETCGSRNNDGLDQEYPDVHRGAVIMAQPVDVKALSNFRIWLRYDDGIQGEVDLSDLAGHGVFKAWNDLVVFGSVRLGSHGAIEWESDIAICPAAM